ncbi:MAG TPA: acyl-phosphate glycerol 3-phosphate acyltransferase [Opitutae bacterium]|nr:acyl-phosphate glycerol 3-phosphate acyltransferase [Opitutaceae bacterium]HCR28570.1 acyl-phosphate glycerol 3-phosphate acyltransferase [Opitutae bacterium]|tara:strand:- start:1344 stop:1973 length:630 start_codon:yes stop_codon:yes gene_type:complete
MPLDIISAALSAGIGYALGSLAFGYWVAKANGLDIFSVGSRNPGATNVKRSVGKGAGNLVFVLDFLKGLIAAGWPLIAYSKYPVPEYYALVGMFGAVIGHSFSAFTRFKGGKGVATMLGGVLALMPWVALIGLAVWALVFYSTRYVSLSSIFMAVSLPVSNWLLESAKALIWVSVLLAIVIVYRHKSNIGRLLRGEENRFDRKGSAGEN